MNEQEQENRTEQATEKRLRDIGEKGERPRSRDFNSAAVTFTAIVTILIMGRNFAEDICKVVKANLHYSRDELFNPEILPSVLEKLLMQSMLLLYPILTTTFITAIVIPFLLSGCSFSWQRLEPKINKLNLSSGMARIFSQNVFVELIKVIIKIILIGFVGFLLFHHYMPTLFTLSNRTSTQSIIEAIALVGHAVLMMTGALFLIGTADIPWQLFDYARRHRMSRKEVQEEYKETEGRPEIKNRIRTLRYQKARGCTREKIQKTEVVNPVYSRAQVGAP